MSGSEWTCGLSSMHEWEFPYYEPSLPVSEKSNPLTRDIDRASSGCIVRMLQACDSQMFLEEAGATYQDPRDGLVVLSGCGTSGRLAFLITSAFNRALKELNQSPGYSYIIAGGDEYGWIFEQMLTQLNACEGKKRVLFIGISCGLSLDLWLQNPQVYTPVLVGFNPTHQARDEPIPGCSFTFRSVVQRMEELAESQKAFLINPAVGGNPAAHESV
ncbi:hypothetical protein CesoFtcFv8_027448 [Champsocephalus esox]|uniref:SIS domain-containing protein n=1 Tax=Champsocephalus esox TaxID=159716 RepID=A0AAN8AYS4_9TELE|nr:hypothetical protein CesoFtcFv8_027448 [Champsocephalus esox]